jgi:transposase-like protein
MAADLSGADLLAVQIDGLHISDGLLLVAAIGIDGAGDKHPLALVEGATENTATVQALIDNLIERGLDPTAPRLFIVDGAKALSKAIRASFGKEVAIQRCQIHYAELRIMPTSVAKPAWEAVIAVKDAA